MSMGNFKKLSPYFYRAYFGLFRNLSEKVQILGCERAAARLHPKIWDTATLIPREPYFAYLSQKLIDSM